ncbi:Rieske 2Fe-2S domain-containing protein [Alloalcanivorax sp. C16-1]|uniref:Rieske 2Fe-2S domain-containing protein n=1 Tax=Alloalcanivorax sp. C16-1 TaxID=3390051 RepID=UPI0039710610
MTRPVRNIIASSRRAATAMADNSTPFIYNEWYVAAFGEELGRALLARRILGRRVVLYRTEAGHPVALEDRCPHRSFPLSESSLEGDTIVCGYHGFRYNTEGDLVEVPSQNACPKGIGVHAYPLVERGPLVWIWMGDPDRLDESRIPHQEWFDSGDWEYSTGYLYHRGNYVSMHENLMDLTHLSYLHADTIGTPDYAGAPYDMDLTEGNYKLHRRVVPTRLSPVWGKSTGLDGLDSAARLITSEFVSPALHRVSGTFYDSALPDGERPEYRICTAHILTPETAHTMHYFLVHGRDFATEDEHITKFMHEQLFAAFEEDVVGLGKLEDVLKERDDSTFEISVASDAPAIATRTYLKKRAEQDAGPAFGVNA